MESYPLLGHYPVVVCKNVACYKCCTLSCQVIFLLVLVYLLETTYQGVFGWHWCCKKITSSLAC